jgi:hypothetical protein
MSGLTFDDLRRELDAWGQEGRVARFWWRDDDAVAATPALDRLLALAEAAGVPLGLAVIPALEDAALAERLDRESAAVRVLQHGFRHQNRAPDGQKKSEYPASLPAGIALAELSKGMAGLKARHGPRFAPIFVPPWNRVSDPALLDGLAQAGMRLSIFRPRDPAATPAPVNTHCDPVAWHDAKRFLGLDAALGVLIGHLRARRLGQAGTDPAEPTGLLSHHLIHDTETWDFLATMSVAIRDHPAAEWADPKDLAKDPR